MPFRCLSSAFATNLSDWGPMKLLFSTDWTDWEQEGFERAAGLLGASVDVMRQRFGAARRTERYVAGAFEAARVVARMSNYDAALVWQQVVGVSVAVVAPSSRLRRCPLTIMGFIWSDSGPLALRKVRSLATARALRRAAAIVCYSSLEAERLRSAFPSASSKVHFERLGFDIPERSYRASSEQLVIVSAGVSNRDYATLCAAASSVPATIRVFARPDVFNVTTPVPSNLELEREFTWSRFFRELGRARAVVIPIDEPRKTAGQLVAIQAMHLGRAIVATQCDGLRDYLRHGETAILVPAHDASGLADALSAVAADPELAERLGGAARREASTQLTAGAFWGRILEIVRATSENAKPPRT